MNFSGVTFELSEDALDALADVLMERVALRLENRPSPPEGGWMSVQAAAEYAGCTPNTIQKAARGEDLESRQDPNCKLWFRRSWIDAWRGL